MNGFKVAVACIVLAVLSACSAADPESDPKLELGDFSLSHNVVVTKNARKIGPSRTASPEEWEVLLETAIAERLGRYDGEKLYHIGINLDGYALAVPGIPVVLAPKSAMVITVNVWDDAAQEKLGDEPRQLTVFEQFDGGTIVGSGLSRTRDEQMDNLARQMAAAVERYLRANAEWFGASTDQQAKEAAEADILTLPDTDAASEPSTEN